MVGVNLMPPPVPQPMPPPMFPARFPLLALRGIPIPVPVPPMPASSIGLPMVEPPLCPIRARFPLLALLGTPPPPLAGSSIVLMEGINPTPAPLIPMPAKLPLLALRGIPVPVPVMPLPASSVRLPMVGGVNPPTPPLLCAIRARFPLLALLGIPPPPPPVPFFRFRRLATSATGMAVEPLAKLPPVVLLRAMGLGRGQSPPSPFPPAPLGLSGGNCAPPLPAKLAPNPLVRGLTIGGSPPVIPPSRRKAPLLRDRRWLGAEVAGDFNELYGPASVGDSDRGGSPVGLGTRGMAEAEAEAEAEGEAGAVLVGEVAGAAETLPASSACHRSRLRGIALPALFLRT
ncbi:unnamed protein product [Closterium sp. NIES-64]|nr:unnamed protein product [Closterium sp. NIES-64]